MRAENAESRAEMHHLRQDLQATRALLERPATGAARTATAATVPRKRNRPPRQVTNSANAQAVAPARRASTEVGRIDVTYWLEDRRTIPDQGRKCLEVPRSTPRNRFDERLPQRGQL